MRVAALAVVFGLFAAGLAQAQAPDLGPVAKTIDQAVGQAVHPALNATYAALGQNITREDVRLMLWANMTKGDVNAVGLLLGSGRGEVQAALHMRMEIRVLSTDRLRAMLEGDNAYNLSARNTTFLSQAYIPAEVFRATLTAEAVAAFQRAEEEALGKYLHRTLPEMDILSLDFTWSHVLPTESLSDTSLTEPPIVLDIDLVVQYIRIESIPSLLHGYLASTHDPAKVAKKDYVKRLKEENGEPLRSRDFFAAAAYTQLLNLSMQPGWSLDIKMHLARGYSFSYFNDAVQKDGDRDAEFHADALHSDTAVHKVVLASITQRKAVALALLTGLWGMGLVVAVPMRFLYGRYRLPRMRPK